MIVTKEITDTVSDEHNFDTLETIEITTSPNQGKERIDKFLFAAIKRISRNKIQNLIEKGYVTVDGNKIRTNYKVVADQSIKVNIPRPKKIDVVAENIPIEFAYQDKYLAVVNKQAGLVVHPTYSYTGGTLVNALMHHFGDELSAVNGDMRPGIVHRLDKNTTGLMVVAKDDTVHQPLADQFADKSAGREYYGICIGKFKEKKGRVETNLKRWQRDRKIIVPCEFEGKRAVTNYEVVEFGYVTLVECRLETGRTHQIRVHMKHLRRPLFGDPTYGGVNLDMINLPRNQINRLRRMLEVLPRQALHARRLEFFHPILKERVSFEAEMPDDMKQILDMIREYNY